jgi:hypothetical protein
MSVLYCALVSNKEKVKIAQSSSGRTFELQIKTIIPQIFKNSVIDRLEFDDNFLTYTRSKEVTFLCISPKRLGEERPRKFLELLINKLVSRNFIEEYGGDINDLLESEKKKGNIKELALQLSIGNYIDTQINNFNSGAEDSLLTIKDIQKDVNQVSKTIRGAIIQQSKNINELNENLLPTTEKIKTESIFYKKNVKIVEGETRFCCKPWVIKTTITIGTIILLFVIYSIVAYTRCGNFNAFCQDK